MKKISLIYGLIIGALLSVNMVYMVSLCYNDPNFEGNTPLGYAVMIVIFSLIYVGVRNFRNKELDGFISWGRAFTTGMLIVFIAGTMYVVCWLIYYYNFVPDFMDKYIAHILKETPVAELEAKRKEMANMKEMYKNPLFIILMTYFEVLPVGILVSLISAFVLKNKSTTR